MLLNLKIKNKLEIINLKISSNHVCSKLIHKDAHIKYEVDQRTLLQPPFAWFSRHANTNIYFSMWSV